MPAVAPVELTDDGPLDQPIEEDFRVGAMALGWDAEAGRVVIEAQEITDEDDPDSPEPAVLRVRVTAGVARAFIKRAQALVAAGRPPCPLCGQPLDPEGHVCVRLNGYRASQGGA